MYDWRTYEQAMTDLSRLPADERLQALINEWSTETQSLSDDELRKLFVFVWPDGRESADDTSEVLLRMLQSMAPVRDSETYLSGALSIFRAAAGDNGIRWTLDEAAATAKAAGRDTNLFSATVAAEDVLGHFTNDGGNEVLVPRRTSARSSAHDTPTAPDRRLVEGARGPRLDPKASAAGNTPSARTAGCTSTIGRLSDYQKGVRQTTARPGHASERRPIRCPADDRRTSTGSRATVRRWARAASSPR